jgi:peptidoglycan hydrolase FlgJ
MVNSQLDNALALNPQGLNGLRALASQGNSRESLKAAASQFEAYFTQLMLKSMRQTLSQDGLMDSQETRSFTEMYDQQIAQKVSKGKGLGLADMMLAQLDRQAAANPADGNTGGLAPAIQNSAEAASSSVTGATKETAVSASKQTTSGSFIDQVWPYAVEAAKSLGVSPHLLVAHAALESGWGKHELKLENGASSNNLFNIKAGSQWTGKTVEKTVTEYVNGKPVQSQEKFRAYASAADAFADYANLLGSSQRYAGVLNQDAEGFVRGLQQGGFATDPAYADKLRRVIGSSALRSGLSG